MRILFHVLFLIITLGDIAGRILSSPILDYIFKPLIMISLLVYFYLSIGKPINFMAKLFMVAIVFSWGGDVLLMLNDINPLFFMLGLLSFLLSHLFFISTYLQSVKGNPEPSVFRRKPHFLLPFAAVFIGLYLFLYPQLKELAIPVFVYAAVLVSMAAFALNRMGKVSSESFLYVFLGAVFFVISDACIAINKFSIEFAYSGIVIMATYILAQYLIVEGIVKEIKMKD